MATEPEAVGQGALTDSGLGEQEEHVSESAAATRLAPDPLLRGGECTFRVDGIVVVRGEGLGGHGDRHGERLGRIAQRVGGGGCGEGGSVGWGSGRGQIVGCGEGVGVAADEAAAEAWTRRALEAESVEKLL